MTTYSYPVAIIASGATTSQPIDLTGNTLCGLKMPAAFTGTALTFSFCEKIDGTYVTLYKDGADLSVSVAASKGVVLDPVDFACFNFVKIISNASEGAARSIMLFGRPVG